MQRAVKVFIDPKAGLLLEKLPNSAKKKFTKQINFLKDSSSHPSLHFKKVGNYWSLRIDDNYRALAYNNLDYILVIWVGSHKDYEKKIRK